MKDNSTLQLPVTQFDKQYKKRIDAYNKLSPLHQAIVHSLALIYDQTARTH